MFANKHKFILTLTVAALLGNAASAQEIGGSLGSSAGIFRPKNPVSATKSATAAPHAKRLNARRAAAASAPRKSQIVVAAAAPVAARRTARKTKAAAKRLDARARLEALIAEGNEARDQRAFLNAERAYLNAHELNRRDARPVYGLGNIYTDQQRWDEAENAYRQTLKIDAQQPAANIALSYVLLQPNRGGNVAARFAEAEIIARRAITLDPENPLAHDQLGVALEQRGLPAAEVESAYRRAIEIAPDFALAHAHLARLFRKNGRLSESDESYRRAVELAKDAPMMIFVTEVLLGDRQSDEAEKLARKAASVDADNPTAMYLLGRSLLLLGRYAEAEDALVRSIQLSPHSFAVYNSLNIAYLRQEKFEDAERILTDALPLAGEAERRQIAGIFGLSAVGDGYLRRGDKSAALRVYKKALELDDKNAQIAGKIFAVDNDGGENR